MLGLFMFGAEIERYVGPRRAARLLLRIGGDGGADPAHRAAADGRAAGARRWGRRAACSVFCSPTR